MPSRPSARTALLLALAALCVAYTAPAGRAFYMPPEFEADAVPGSDANATAAHASSGPFAFHHNHTETVGTGTGAGTGMGTGTAPAQTVRALETAEMGRDKAVALFPRDVWSPPVVHPDAGTVWTAGSKVKVVWDTSTRPSHVTNWEGRVVLGHYEDGDDTNEHLDFDHPLAEGFNLTLGHVNVQVPNVSPSNEYIIVLFGDSGNRSPKFTIVD